MNAIEIVPIITHPKTWITLDKIQHALGWSDVDFADRLNLTEKRFHFLRARKIEPSLYSVTQLIDQVGLSIDRIVSGNIDYEALRAHAGGDLFHVPEKYMIAPFSKRRTSIHLFEYVEHYFGWLMKRSILNHFQLTEAVFSNPELMINFLFLSDFCKYLIQSGYSPNIFPLMGAYSVVTNKNTDIGNLIASFKSPKNIFERVFSDVVGKSFDRNCNYKLLKLDDDGCLIEAKLNQELQDLLKQTKLGNSHVCTLRGSSFSSLTGYLDLPHCEVTEIACIHRGDPCCQYQISYQQAQSLYLRTKLFQPTFH